jgi:tetratricopeptide (TPR) repeat protein
MNNKLLLTAILILILTNIALYGKTSNYDFVGFDDKEYINDNTLIRELSSENIKKTFSSFYFSNYQPLVLLSYAAEYRFFKLAPGGYHVTNTVIHTINSILVLFLIYIITKNGWISFLVALLFSLHPIQVESVAWVSERKGLMCAFFYLLSFMAYIRFSRNDKKSFYFLSIVLFLFSLLSKPMSVTFPIILILFDYLEQKVTKKKLIEKIPFFALSAASSVITVFAQESGGSIGTSKFKYFLYLFSLAFYNISFYISKLIAPINLSVNYEYPKSVDYLSSNFFIGILIFIILIVYLMNFKKIKRELNFAILFFLVSLLPILRFVPIGKTLAADRYMYMPMIGFFFAIAILLNSIAVYKPALKKGLISAVLIYSLSLSILTYAQCKVWVNSYTLFTNVLKTSPNHYNALLIVGNFYLEKKETKKARELFMRAVKDPEGRELALFDIGISYVYELNPEEAKKYFMQLINEFPENKKANNTLAYLFLGDISAHNKKFKEAAGFYEKSLRLNQKNLQAHYRYAKMLEGQGNIKEAVKHYKLASEIDNNWEPLQKALERLTRPGAK